jgi:hypothetical protein
MTADATRFLSALLCVLGAVTFVLLAANKIPDKSVLLVPVAFIAFGLFTASRTAS